MFRPLFVITPKINSRVAEIERLRTLMDQASILPDLAVQLRFRATVEAVHSSTSIEGNPLSEGEVKKLLEGKTVATSDYAMAEVLNYKRALDWLNQPQQLGREFQTTDILHLHKIVMAGLLPKEKLGHWRPGPVYVTDEVGQKEIVRYVGPEARDVPKLVKGFLEWIPLQIQASLHPVLVAGLIHYLFVSIHPFSDGNGRITRLLTYQYLKNWHYDFRGSLSLDSYYSGHRLAYYAALSRGITFDERMAANVTEFLDFFTKGFLGAAEELYQYIRIGKKLAAGQKPLRLSPEELTLLDYAQQFGSVTVKETVVVLSVTKRTAQRRLMHCVENGLLRVLGLGPATRYMLNSLP